MRHVVVFAGVAMLGALVAAGCGRVDPRAQVKLGPPERFDWVPEPIEFSPPPTAWRREGDNGGGLLGVRFILSGGGGQVMSVAAYRQWSEKLPRKEIALALAHQPTLAELLPHMRLVPGERQNPSWWVLGSGRDTVLAGLPAHVSNDTLLAPEQKLLYRQVYWVVDGTGFQAIYQGRPENQHVFEKLVESVRFPESDAAR
jgi:hypothetical protein